MSEEQEEMSKTKSEETPFQLSLTGEGFDINRAISKETALRVIGLIMNVGQRGNLLTPMRTNYSDTATPLLTELPKSLREYLNEVQASNNPEKILAIAYYLTSNRENKTVDRKEVGASFRLASEPLPANLSRDFQETVRSGWIAADLQTPRRYYVTRYGLEALQSKFSSNRKSVVRRVRRRTIPSDGGEPEATKQPQETLAT